MPLITQMFAWVIEETPGDEGVPAFMMGGMWFPLMGADIARMESVREKAQEIATMKGKPVRLLKFTHMEEVEVLKP